MTWITYARTEGDRPRTTAPLGGPYANLEEAKADLIRVQRETAKHDSWSHFYKWFSGDTDIKVTKSLFGTPTKGTP